MQMKIASHIPRSPARIASQYQAATKLFQPRHTVAGPVNFRQTHRYRMRKLLPSSRTEK